MISGPRVTRLFAGSSALYLLAWIGAALADGISPGSVPWLAQLHLALFGFIGMMIFGMSYLFVPNFSGRMLTRTDWAVAHLALAHAGAAGGFAALLAASPADWVLMALYAVGGVLWVATLVTTLRTPRPRVPERGLVPLDPFEDAHSPRRRVDRWARVATMAVPLYLLAAAVGFAAAYRGDVPYASVLHLYTTGFVALMVFGAGYHLIPRFTGVVPPPRYVAANIGLGIAGPGLIGLTIEGPADLFPVAALLEATAGLMFAAFVFHSLLRTERRRRPAFLCYAASGASLVLGVLLGFGFAVDLSWRIYVPVHAWVNLFGFAGLMIVGVTIDAFIAFRSSDARDLRSFGALFASGVAGLVLTTASYAGTPTRLPGLALLFFAAVLYAHRLLTKLRDIDEAERRFASGGAGGAIRHDAVRHAPRKGARGGV